MAGQGGFFDAEERLRWLSASGDPLERLRAVVEFEAFRGELEVALPRADRSRGGRPPYDAVLMFRVLVLQALSTLSDEQTEYQLRDRLSFMRFAGLALHDAVPDAKTIWLYREQLILRCGGSACATSGMRRALPPLATSRPGSRKRSAASGRLPSCHTSSAPPQALITERGRMSRLTKCS